MLRPSNPADLVTLLLQARPLPIVARGRHALALGRCDRVPWGGMMEEWLLDRGRRRTWILPHHGVAAGLISCCRYKSATTWDVDLLQIAQGSERALPSMLDDLNVRLGKMGVERLVLRLSEDSPIRPIATEAGFTALMRERIWIRPGGFGAPLSTPITGGEEGDVRPGREADIYQLYRLYCASVPLSIRQMEGLTRNDGEQTPVRGGMRKESRWVLEREGQVVAAVTMEKGSGRRRLLDVLTNPRSPAKVDALLAEAVAAEGERSTLMSMLPEYLWGACSVEGAFGEAAFKDTGTVTVYSKPILARVRSVAMLPARA